MNEVAVASRRATVADLETLEWLVSEAGMGIAEARGGAAHLNVDASGWSLAQRSGDPLARVFVGTIDEAVIGFTVVSHRSVGAGYEVGRIEAIYVEPEARELGVGEELLNAAVRWCRSVQCVSLDAVALPGDRGTKNFFETFGMVARAIVVSRSLAETAD